MKNQMIKNSNFFSNLKAKMKENTLNQALIISLSVVGLGCSSSDVGLHYYSLNAITSQPTNSTIIKSTKDKEAVVLNGIEMADFLNTGGLVMQIDSHQLHISNQHLWGDKLPKAIENHLISSLADEKSPYYLERKNLTNINSANKYLTLSFEQFTVTGQNTESPNETVISGSYVIESTLDNNETHSQKAFFDIRQPLTQDGYNHAVESFKTSLNRLSTQIQNDL